MLLYYFITLLVLHEAFQSVPAQIETCDEIEITVDEHTNEINNLVYEDYIEFNNISEQCNSLEVEIQLDLVGFGQNTSFFLDNRSFGIVTQPQKDKKIDNYHLISSYKGFYDLKAIKTSSLKAVPSNSNKVAATIAASVAGVGAVGVISYFAATKIKTMLQSGTFYFSDPVGD